MRPLWTCPVCEARFTTRNQRHSCGRFSLDALFARSEPAVRDLFDRFVALAKAQGPVTVIPQKSRVALQARMRFAAVTPQRHTLAGHLIMRERHDAPCFTQVEQLGHCYRHVFKVDSARALAPLRAFMRKAYRTGTQEDL